MDIFDTIPEYLITEYHSIAHKTVILYKQTVNVSELQDILKDWDYHENVLDAVIYNSKAVDRKFLIVTPLEETNVRS